MLNVVYQNFPNSPHRYCRRHIYADFQAVGFRAEELKQYIDQASDSYTKNGFDVVMAKLKDEDEEAWKWLVRIPKETWARHAMDMNCKKDLVVNNISEVFNRYILELRLKPIKTMTHVIRSKLMVKYQGTRNKIEEARWEITPTYAERLEESNGILGFAKQHNLDQCCGKLVVVIRYMK